MIFIEKYELVKFIDGEFELKVNESPNEETIWMTLDEIAILFERDSSVIGKHTRKIYLENELNEKRTRAKNARHLEDGRVYKVDIYNFDVKIAVGYRENSKIGTLFRIWTNQVLKYYLLKGNVINENRVTVSNENYMS